MHLILIISSLLAVAIFGCSSQGNHSANSLASDKADTPQSPFAKYIENNEIDPNTAVSATLRFKSHDPEGTQKIDVLFLPNADGHCLELIKTSLFAGSSTSPVEGALYRGREFIEINRQIEHASLKGCIPLSAKVLKEKEVYQESSHSYLNIVLEASTEHGLTGETILQTYIIPFERIWKNETDFGYYGRQTIRYEVIQGLNFPLSKWD